MINLDYSKYDNILPGGTWNLDEWFNRIHNSGYLDTDDMDRLRDYTIRNNQRFEQTVDKARNNYLINDLINQLEYHKRSTQGYNRKNSIYTYLGHKFAQALTQSGFRFSKIQKQIQDNASIGKKMQKQDYKDIDKIINDYSLFDNTSYYNLLVLNAKHNIRYIKAMHTYYTDTDASRYNINHRYNLHNNDKQVEIGRDYISWEDSKFDYDVYPTIIDSLICNPLLMQSYNAYYGANHKLGDRTRKPCSQLSMGKQNKDYIQQEQQVKQTKEEQSSIVEQQLEQLKQSQTSTSKDKNK